MIVEKIIRKLKKDPGYKWENSYDAWDLALILKVRTTQLIRGFFKKIFFKKHKGFAFIGKRVTIRHKRHFSAGANLILEDNVFINALSAKGVIFGDNVTIARDSIILCTGIVAHVGEGITIGNGTGINARAFFGGQGGIEIGNNVIIGPDTKIFSENHNFSDGDIVIKKQGVTRKKVVIKDNCWIGAGVIVLSGVIIEEGCVVAAGSVVTKSFPPNVIVGGVPAKIIKQRG
jgi:acetyltransferase-like isoleucine patch superfamily enzyme